MEPCRIDFAGGDTNLYGYVVGDPVNFVDPSGEAKSGWDKFWEWWGGEGTDDMREKSFCVYKNATGSCEAAAQQLYLYCSSESDRAELNNIFYRCMTDKLDCKDK